MIITSFVSAGVNAVSSTLVDFAGFFFFFFQQVPRQFPYNNLYLSRGGDPNAAPTEKSLHAPIKSTYGEIFS